MCFKIRRESPRDCGAASYVSLIQCYPDSTFMKYVTLHTYVFYVCGVMSCPDLQSCVMKCMRFHMSVMCAHTCVLICAVHACMYIHIQKNQLKLLSFTKLFLFDLEK